MIYTTDLSFVTGIQARKLTFGLIESFDTKNLRTENILICSKVRKKCKNNPFWQKNSNFSILTSKMPNLQNFG